MHHPTITSPSNQNCTPCSAPSEWNQGLACIIDDHACVTNRGSGGQFSIKSPITLINQQNCQECWFSSLPSQSGFVPTIVYIVSLSIDWTNYCIKVKISFLFYSKHIVSNFNHYTWTTFTHYTIWSNQNTIIPWSIPWTSTHCRDEPTLYFN